MFTQETKIPRSPLASTMTLVLHAGLALAVIGVMAIPSIPRVHQSEMLTYIPAAALPEFEFEVPTPPPTPPPPVKLEVPKPEPPKAFEAPAIERPTPPPPPPAPAPERRMAELPKEVAPPPKPAVNVGAFADDATAVRKPERVAEVATTNFDSATGPSARVKREVQTLDVFDTATARATSRATVSDAGFGATAPATTPARAAVAASASGFAAETTPRPAAAPSRTTSAAGFAADAPARTPAAAPKPAAPQAAGFAETASAPKPAPQAPPPPRADRPVEVVYKPSPAYTDEARAQRVEGEVTLDVEFTAAGQVRVLRVVRGLGHGLDEMAQRAAEQIRFRPATSKGTPVDFRATLTIVFRLT